MPMADVKRSVLGSVDLQALGIIPLTENVIQPGSSSVRFRCNTDQLYELLRSLYTRY
jgi:hypothetical protein